MFYVSLATLLLAAGVVTSQAQSAATAVLLPKGPSPAAAAPQPLSSTENWIKEVKSPLSWFTWGGDLRIRDEYYNNAVSLSDEAVRHEQNVIRFRGRIWSTITPVEDVTLNTRLAAEVREWTRPSFTGTYLGQQGMEWRYGIFDNINVKWNNALGQPLTLTAGRQDITIGDFWNWWLVADGTPLDGSWTYFLDSVRATFDAKELKTKFDVIYISQSARPDDWMPTLNANQSPDLPPTYPLTEQNEQGVILYASNKSIENTTLDGFFIYKHDDRELSNGDDANIYTVGARITGLPAEHWQYALEGAYQFGEKTDPTIKVGTLNRERDINAFGANARLSYLLRDPHNNQLHLVGEYLSGDDDSTDGKDEMFDILWGRWPRYSELYIYSYAAETGGRIAQHNNLFRVGGGWTCEPMKRMTVGAYYNALFAPEEVPTRAGGAMARFSQDGSFRGHYLQGVLQHTFSRHVKGHLWAEFVWQGDYYDQRDMMSFLRAEVSVSF
jgi:hypothetical protein